MLHIISNGTENSCFNLKDSLPWFNFSLITKKSILLVRPVSKHEKYDLFIGKICFMPLWFGIHRQYFKLIITYNWWSKLENFWKNVTFVFIHGCRKGRNFFAIYEHELLFYCKVHNFMFSWVQVRLRSHLLQRSPNPCKPDPPSSWLRPFARDETGFLEFPVSPLRTLSAQ